MSTPSPLFTDFRERLVTLCDGRPGLRSGFAAEIREPSLEPGGAAAVLDFIASNDALDRCGEIIDPSGWQLDNYRRNPVFQNAHQYGDIVFTLGKALVTEVRAGNSSPTPHSALRTLHVFQRIEFAVDVNPMARIAYGLYKGKFLNAVSVGFVPLRWVNADGTEHSLNGTRGLEKSPAERTALSQSCHRKYLSQELLEVSAVGIPANPEALQLGLKAGAIQKADLQELVDLLRQLAQTPASPPCTDKPINDPLIPDYSSFRGNPMAGAVADPSARGGGADGAQLLQLARTLRNLLRHA